MSDPTARLTEAYAQALSAQSRRMLSWPARPENLSALIGELCRERFDAAMAAGSTHLTTCSLSLAPSDGILRLSAESGLVLSDRFPPCDYPLSAYAGVSLGFGWLSLHLLRARVALLGLDRFCRRQADALMRGLALREATALVEHQVAAPAGAAILSPDPYGALLAKNIARLSRRDHFRRAADLCELTLASNHAASISYLQITRLVHDNRSGYLKIQAAVSIAPLSSQHIYHVAAQANFFHSSRFLRRVFSGGPMRLLALAMGPDRFARLVARRVLLRLAREEAEVLRARDIPLPPGLIARSERDIIAKYAGSKQGPRRAGARL